MISNFTKNCMGTVDFDGKFNGMRKVQRFCIYPLRTGDVADHLTVQSNSRIGLIRLSDGKVVMSPPHPSGAYGHHLVLAKFAGRLGAEELLLLKSNVFATAHGDAGRSINRVIGTDNAGAIEVFGATA